MKECIYFAQSTHLDLFWMGRMEKCMQMGATIIDDAIEDMCHDKSKFFVIETVRFLEYYLDQYPQKIETVKTLFAEGRLGVGACYTDRLENHHSGESLVRNVTYGKKILRDLLGVETSIALHPDLPGLAEQTPQIYHKTGVKYYIFARGYRYGARFKWAAPNGDEVIAYNYPFHYSYFDYNIVIAELDRIQQAVKATEPLISLSSGDLGPYGTFQRPDHKRESVDDIVCATENRFKAADIYHSLEKMDEDSLPVYSGECPSKWGTYGSATNVAIFLLDKQLNGILCDAETLMTLCEINHVHTDGFQLEQPFCQNERPHLLRDYYDGKLKPESLDEWIEFAWRLQIITQDHNYGGIDGICSAFDRMIYKKSAIHIAEALITFLLDKMSVHDNADYDIMAVNVLNWSREGKIYLSQELDKIYCITDADGNKYRTVTDQCGCYFEPEIEALTCAYYHIEEVKSLSVEVEATVSHAESDMVSVESRYYEARFSKSAGGLVSLIEKATRKDLLGTKSVGVFYLYRDHSNDVHEETYEKALLDTTSGKILQVLTGNNYLYSWISWESEICHSKTRVTVRLSHQRKAFEIIPEIYWIGVEQSQLRMTISLNPEFSELYYGSPYGISEFGRYMTGAEPANPSDEIGMDLFQEYREIQGWFAVSHEKEGVSIGTNISSVAFRAKNEIELVLIRDVVSCGDPDVMMDNHGHQTFTITGTSFLNDEIHKSDKYYKKALEIDHPFHSILSKSADHGYQLPKNKKMLELQGGILSVLQKNNEHYLARLFSVSSEAETVDLRWNGQEMDFENCDMLWNQIAGDSQIQPYDIKNILFKVEG